MVLKTMNKQWLGVKNQKQTIILISGLIYANSA